MKLIVLPVFVNVPPLFVQSPATLCVNEPPTNVVPAPNVTVPPTETPMTAVVLAEPPNVNVPPMEVVPVCKVFAPVPESPRFT